MWTKLSLCGNGLLSSIGSKSQLPKPTIRSRWRDSKTPCCLIIVCNQGRKTFILDIRKSLVAMLSCQFRCTRHSCGCYPPDYESMFLTSSSRFVCLYCHILLALSPHKKMTGTISGSSTSIVVQERNGLSEVSIGLAEVVSCRPPWIDDKEWKATSNWQLEPQELHLLACNGSNSRTSTNFVGDFSLILM